MRTSFYCYGIAPNVYENLPYRKALEVKLLSAKTLVKNLVAADFETRDDEQLNVVLDAIKHTENLLAELEHPESSSHVSIEEFIEPSIEERNKFC